MTGTDFSADGLMRRDVTGGNNQGNAVASLHMTIMMHRISTVADRQPMVRKVKPGEMTGMPAKDTNNAITVNYSDSVCATEHYYSTKINSGG